MMITTLGRSLETPSRGYSWVSCFANSEFTLGDIRNNTGAAIMPKDMMVMNVLAHFVFLYRAVARMAANNAKTADR